MTASRAKLQILDLRETGLPEIPLLGRYTFRQAHGRLEEHAHAGCLELCCLVNGRQVYRLAAAGERPEQACHLRAGDVFVTLPGEEHDTAGQPQERGALYWLHLRLGQSRLLGLGRTESARLREGLLRLPVRHFHGGAKVVKLFAALQECARQDETDVGLRRLRIGAACLQLLLAVLDAAGENHQQAQQQPVGLRKALDYIHQRITEPLPVWAVAQEAGVSVAWLQGQIKRFAGLSAGEFILRKKIALAQQWLREGRSVTAVAHGLGFSSSQYFATVFKRFTTQTPSGWLASGG